MSENGKVRAQQLFWELDSYWKEFHYVFLKNCQSCGYAILKDSEFCSFCGADQNLEIDSYAKYNITRFFKYDDGKRVLHREYESWFEISLSAVFTIPKWIEPTTYYLESVIAPIFDRAYEKLTRRLWRTRIPVLPWTGIDVDSLERTWGDIEPIDKTNIFHSFLTFNVAAKSSKFLPFAKRSAVQLRIAEQEVFP